MLLFYCVKQQNNSNHGSILWEIMVRSPEGRSNNYCCSLLFCCFVVLRSKTKGFKQKDSKQKDSNKSIQTKEAQQLLRYAQPWFSKGKQLYPFGISWSDNQLLLFFPFFCYNKKYKQKTFVSIFVSKIYFLKRYKLSRIITKSTKKIL